KRIEDQLVNRDMALELTDNAKLYLGHKGYDPVMGARPLRRTIQREIEDTLSEKILFNEFVPGQIVIVDVDGDPTDVEKTSLTFRAADKPASIPDTPPAELAGERAPKSPGAGTGTMPPKSPGAGPRGGMAGEGAG
ncbi:hypothetical protein AB0A65_25890, partial [Glycomyces sp. NPDC047010]